MQPLSGLDSSFLYLESPTTHMHIGSVAVVSDTLTFDEFRNLMMQRIHLIPRLRQRLVTVPLSVDRPYWVDDPDFNMSLHLRHVALPRPGNWRALRKLASSVFSEPLDRSRPLWQITFVEGLDTIPQVPPGSVALVVKMHHAAIDGMSGNDILGVLLDPSPQGREIAPAEPWNPEPIPNEVGIVARSAAEFIKRPFKLPALLAETANATVRAGMLTRVKGVELPSVPFTAPYTRINGKVSAERNWNTALLELDRIKEIKNIMGTTLNDVVLAICAGALRRYLAEKGELPKKSLVAMVPISTRSKTDGATMGNQISSMLIQLATEIEDPLERLQEINKHTTGGKMFQGAIGAKALSNVLEIVPFSLGGQAAKLYTRLNVAERVNPVMNLTITNVPGPQMDLYLAGHKLLAIMGLAPIIDGMGLMIAVYSYNGVISMSVTSCPELMPDLDLFARYLRESANTLEAAALAEKPIEIEAEDETAGDDVILHRAESTPFFEQMGAALDASPELVPDNAGLFQFVIKGTDPQDWVVDLNVRPGKVENGVTDSADATFIVKDEHLMKILRGDLGVQIAFMQGKLKVKGDIGKALKLAPLLTNLPPLPA